MRKKKNPQHPHQTTPTTRTHTPPPTPHTNNQKHLPRSLVGVVMPLEVSLILRVLVVGIDLQRVPLYYRAQQIEAGVLIPSPAFIEVDKRKKSYDAQQDCDLAVGRRFLRKGAHRVSRP